MTKRIKSKQIKKKPVKNSTNEYKKPVKNTIKRRKALLELIKQHGLYSINKLQFSKIHGVAHKQIDKDIDQLTPKLDKVDMIREKINLREANKLALKAVIGGLDDEDYIQAARAVGYITEKITKHFESYGDKEKVAEKVELFGDKLIIEFKEPSNEKK